MILYYFLWIYKVQPTFNISEKRKRQKPKQALTVGPRLWPAHLGPKTKQRGGNPALTGEARPSSARRTEEGDRWRGLATGEVPGEAVHTHVCATMRRAEWHTKEGCRATGARSLATMAAAEGIRWCAGQPHASQVPQKSALASSWHGGEV
jgi:hypothetical protein